MLSINSMETFLTEKFPLPRRLFGMEEGEYGSEEWRIRRLVANILVGGSRDKMAVRATEWLFKNYSLEDLCSPVLGTDRRRKVMADTFENEFELRYAGKKADYVLGSVRTIVEDYGHLPSDYSKLKELPGVGHHAASVVRALAFNLPAFGVDLHVRRISKRTGLISESATDRAIEQAFIQQATNPGHLSRAFVEFGQTICRFHPSCKRCELANQCPQKKEIK